VKAIAISKTRISASGTQVMPRMPSSVNEMIERKAPIM
jgi:hypothetical protein